MNKFENWCINIITLIVFVALLIIAGSIIGFVIHSIWQVIN